jgi:hypothetical protein
MGNAFFECESVKLGLGLPFLQDRIHINLCSSYTAQKIHSNIDLFLNSILTLQLINLLNAELNPVCHLLALLGAHHILHVSRIRVKVFLHKNLTTTHSCNTFCCSLKHFGQGCSQSCERSHLASGLVSIHPWPKYFCLFYKRLCIGLRERVFCVRFAGGGNSLSTSYFKAVGLILKW